MEVKANHRSGLSGKSNNSSLDGLQESIEKES